MITIEVSFPLGRYHATPWDRHVNEGAVEWPPSPWRLARALYSVWKERLPDLTEPDVLSALEAVSAPPTYHLPRWGSAATRHYYPASDHHPPAKVSTDKVLDAFVAIDPEATLLMHWPDAELGPAALDALAQLVRAMPFLGRADSVCAALVADAEPDKDHEVHEPTEDGDLLIAVPARPLDPTQLTITTDAMRKQRLRRPPGMVHVAYDTPNPWSAEPGRMSASTRPRRPTTCVVLSAMGRPVPNHVLAVAVSDLVFDSVQSQYTRLTGETAPPVITGHDPLTGAARRDQHRHAHVWPLPAGHSSGPIEKILVYADEGLGPAEVAAIGQVTSIRLSRRAVVGDRDASGKPVVRGLAPARLLVTGVGAVEDLAPELAGDGDHWQSASPFVPSHHQKARRFSGGQIGPFYEDFLIDQLERELHHRGHDARVTSITALPTSDGRVPAQRYRRYRLRQRLADSRPAVWLDVHLDQPVSGPLSLGALSHFGLGLFRPAADVQP